MCTYDERNIQDERNIKDKVKIACQTYMNSKWLSFYLHTKYRILELKNKECKVLNATAIASDYTGRDPQGGTSDGSFFSKFSFKLQSMVKDLLFVL